MKYSLLIAAQLIMNSCGANNHNDCYLRGNQCPTPEPGLAGKAGTDGYNVALETSNVSSCTNGGITIFMGRDLDRNGKLRYSSDAKITSVTICNGINGINGINGTNGTNGKDGKDGVIPVTPSPITIIDPCGKQTANDEVIIRLANNTLISSFSDSANGYNTRFALLKPGNYITSDGTFCNFTVQPNLDVTF